jgi:septal ring factor EnvC (AmiA/AmiB activator)
MDAKELILAVNFSKAPQELQDAVKASADTYKKMEKLRANILAEQAELLELEKQVGAQDKVVRKLLSAWDPSSLGVKA